MQGSAPRVKRPRQSATSTSGVHSFHPEDDCIRKASSFLLFKSTLIVQANRYIMNSSVPIVWNTTSRMRNLEGRTGLDWT